MNVVKNEEDENYFRSGFSEKDFLSIDFVMNSEEVRKTRAKKVDELVEEHLNPTKMKQNDVGMFEYEFRSEPHFVLQDHMYYYRMVTKFLLNLYVLILKMVNNFLKLSKMLK